MAGYNYATGSPRGGLLAQLTALIGTQLAYLRARFELAGIEGKEALINWAIIVALGVVALVVVIFGYLFVVASIVALIAWACGGGIAYFWTALGAGILHLVIAAALGFVAKTRISRRMFEATMEEFKKDQIWLTKRANQS